jgi:signal transduction histidine kinase/ligand-binding sensor domain-containing protein/DNA-binding response OmpR family regulator
MNMFKIAFSLLRFFCAYLFFPAILSAQSHFFSTLTTRDGLPSNVISAVAQDKDHFIWIGTANGLARFDGYHFVTFKREENENALPANEISSLLVDGDHLWVGTWRGLCKINTHNFHITRIPPMENAVIRTLYKDRNNIIWIGTADGLSRLAPDQSTKIFNVENSNLSHNTIRSIYQDVEGNLWVGTYNKLNKLARGSDKFITIDLKGDYKPELNNNLICDIKPLSNSDSLIWVGTETGLCLLNTHSHRYTRYDRQRAGFSNEVIKNVYTGPDNELWLGTDFGLNLYNPVSGKSTAYFHNPQLSYSIANNVIWQIFEDDGGVIWIVTSNGLSRISKHSNAFTYKEITHKINGQTIGNQVKSMLLTREGILWMATIHGVIRMDLRQHTQQVFDIESPPSERLLLNNVFTLEEDDFGRIWIGTAGGINVWDEKANRMYAITANETNGLSSNYIAKFTKGADGSFWVSAWEGGLFKIVSGFTDLKAVKFEFVGDFASEKNTYAMNAIWGINNNELYRIDLSNFVSKKITAFNALAKGKDIYNLYYTAKGSFWSGTQNGLIEYKPGIDSATFHPIVTGDDIEFNNINSDNFGNIWAATNKFILKFSPAQNKYEIFPLDKGLPLKTFYTNCSARSQHNELMFGGDNGFIIFKTDIRPYTYQPSVFLTALEINNKRVAPFQKVNDHITLTEDIPFIKELTLDYSQRSVTFEFSSLDYGQPDINLYAYKLEGFDKDWKYVSSNKNFAVYSNLMPGKYRLVVKGTNNYGIWSDHIASLDIKILPPLLLRPAFIVLYVILAIATVIIALRIYIARLKLRNELKIAVLQKEHAEEIVQTKQQFFTSISHELRTPISLIIPPLQQILKRGRLDEEDKSLMAIAEKNSQRLLRLINQILDFRKLEHQNQSLKISWFDLIPFAQELFSLFEDRAARNDIDFQFNARIKSCSIWADKEKIEIIIFNLLANAFKFTPKRGRIELSIDIDNTLPFQHGAVKIAVLDSGIGIAPEEQSKIFEQFYQATNGRIIEDGSGIGLTLVSEYTRMHRGEIKLISAKDAGSNFTIFLPLGSDHFPVNNKDEQAEVNVLATKPQEDGNDNYAFNLRSDKPVVLIAEDNIDIVDFILIALKEKYNFITAENGEEAWQKTLSLMPEIIISDIMMPVVDGLELCKRIKEDNKTSHIPIILLTAKSLTAHKIEGIRMGADIYMTKPFEVDLLEAHIDHLLERKAELAQYFKYELITQPKSNDNKENEDDKFLKKVMNTIEANIANPDFSVETLSDEMGMSTTHLYRKLKSLTHLSANEIIKKYRIKKASLLLKNKEGNISEIMYEVGFSNLSYFSKCFKSEFGISPKEYQQKESRHSYNLQEDLQGGKVPPHS